METSSRPKVILADKYGQELCEALGINTDFAHVSRIVIDVRSGEPVKVYLEMLGTDKMLGVRLPTSAVEVITSA